MRRRARVAANASAEEVQDILCREELDALAQDHAHRFSLHHTLSKPPSADWAQSKGRVTLQMLRQHLPPPGEDTLVVRPMLAIGSDPPSSSVAPSRCRRRR